jgi:hypothetical protein
MTREQHDRGVHPLALALGFLLGCLGLAAGAAEAGEPIRIGASMSNTGTYAKLGRYMQEAYLLW